MPSEKAPDAHLGAPAPGTALRALVTMAVVAASQEATRARGAAAWTATALGVALAGAAATWAPRRGGAAAGDAAASPREAAAARVVLAIAAVASVAWSVAARRAVWPAAPAWLLVVLALGVGMTASAIARPRMAIVAAAGAVVTGLALRAVDFALVPIDARRADMVPLVVAALDRLFRGGSPYATYAMPWELPLTYLPLTWLAFAPAVLAGIDPRWTSAACDLAVFAVLLRVAGGRRAPAAAPLALLFAAWFPAGSVVAADALTAMPAQSLAIGVSMALVAVGARAAPVALGLALATTPLAAALLPLVIVRWTRDGARTMARRLGAAAAVAAIVILPWAAWDPRAFWAGTFRWFNDLDGFPRRMASAWTHVAGFTGLFWAHGAEALLRPFQLVVVAAVAVAYARAARDPAASGGAAWLGAAVATFVGFVLFNVIVWPYLYGPASVLAMAAVAVAPATIAKRAPQVAG